MKRITLVAVMLICGGMVMANGHALRLHRIYLNGHRTIARRTIKSKTVAVGSTPQ